MFYVKRKKRSGAIKRIRAKFGRDVKFELLIFCSNRNVYAQIIDLKKGMTKFTVSTLSRDNDNSHNNDNSKKTYKVESKKKNYRNINIAHELGVKVAERCKAEKISDVSFNRAEKIFHGVVKAVADGFYENLE